MNKYRAPNDEMKPGKNGSIFPAIVIAETVFDIVCEVAVKCKIKQRQCLPKLDIEEGRRIHILRITGKSRI